jgi:hypothetical protein
LPALFLATATTAAASPIPFLRAQTVSAAKLLFISIHLWRNIVTE